MSFHNTRCFCTCIIYRPMLSVKRMYQCSTRGDWLKKEFWNNQYKQRLKDGQSRSFDFLLSFNELYPQLEYLLPTKPYTFMNLGCGMSDFSTGLYQKTRPPSIIYEVDFAIEALKHAQRLFIQNYVSPVDSDTISGEGSKVSRKSACVSFIQALAQRLPFRDDSMDVILDKGTSDTVLRATNDTAVASQIASESFRILIPDGLYLQVTDEDPDVRVPFLQQELLACNSDVSFKTVELNRREYFIYFIKKTKG